MRIRGRVHEEGSIANIRLTIFEMFKSQLPLHRALNTSKPPLKSEKTYHLGLLSSINSNRSESSFLVVESSCDLFVFSR